MSVDGDADGKVNSESKVGDDGQQGEKTESRGKGIVIPSFQSFADEIRRARAQKSKKGQTGEVKKQICRPLMSEEELRSGLNKILRQFFVCAFTIVIKAKNLCPSQAFQEIHAFGISVPSFLHPSSLEYVKEVSRKMVTFMNRSTCEGAAMHVMIEKNKALHVVQRFVFRTNGSLEVLRNVDDEENEQFDLDELKSRCRSSLLRLMNAEIVKPMIVPQYSRWSISIGLKKEFIDTEDIDELWRTDPNGSYFPWKKRPRSLASIQKFESLATSKCSDVVTGVSDNDDKSTSTVVAQMQPVLAINGSAVNGESNEVIATSEEPKVIDGDGRMQQEMTAMNQPVINPTENSNAPSSDVCKTICFPLSSFPVTYNFMISIYGLDYAAPVASVFNSSIFSPKVPRSPTGSSLRMSQIRQRLLKYSSKMH